MLPETPFVKKNFVTYYHTGTMQFSGIKAILMSFRMSRTTCLRMYQISSTYIENVTDRQTDSYFRNYSISKEK